MTAQTATASPDLDWLLAQFLNQVPGTRAAIVAATDGLSTIKSNLAKEDADRLAAIISGLFSLGKGVGKVAGLEAGGIRQVVVELDGALLFVSAAGSGSVLGVLTDPAVDVGAVGFEMSMLVKSVTPYLSTALRAAPAAAAGSAVR